MISIKNSEGYSDPTAEVAMHRVDQEDIERKKKYLRQYHEAEVAIEELQLEQARIFLEVSSPKAINYDGMPHGSTVGDPLGNAAIKIDEINQEIKNKLAKKWEIRKKIVADIEKMESETEKSILRYRYIQWMKWEKIAEMMNLEVRQVHRCHGRALNNFKMS